MAENEAMEIIMNTYIQKFNKVCNEIKEIVAEIGEKKEEIKVLRAKADAYREIIFSVSTAREMM